MHPSLRICAPSAFLNHRFQSQYERKVYFVNIEEEKEEEEEEE